LRPSSNSGASINLYRLYYVRTLTYYALHFARVDHRDVYSVRLSLAGELLIRITTSFFLICQRTFVQLLLVKIPVSHRIL
jgi:hypothetical protein